MRKMVVRVECWYTLAHRWKFVVYSRYMCNVHKCSKAHERKNKHTVKLKMHVQKQHTVIMNCSASHYLTFAE